MLYLNGPVGHIDPERPINIIGAGISGLLLGYHLKKSGKQVHIYEASAKAGGKIGTSKRQEGLAESAANAIYADEHIYELLQELELPYLAPKQKLKKLIWRNRPTSPVTIKNFFVLLFSVWKKIQIQNDNETVEVVIGRIFGEKFCREVIAPALAGIYAEDISRLHFQSVFPNAKNGQRFIHFIKSRKSKVKRRSISFHNGMQDFVDRISLELQDCITYNAEVDKLLDNTIVCTDAIQASKLLAKSEEQVSRLLMAIQYTKTTSSTLITKNKIPFLAGAFGILFSPKHKELRTLGIVANSEVFDHRAHGNLSSYTFIQRESENVESQIMKDLETLGLSHVWESKRDLKINSWKRSIPIYGLQRYQTIQKIKKIMAKEETSFALFGNYVNGISIREMNLLAKTFANKI